MTNNELNELLKNGNLNIDTGSVFDSKLRSNFVKIPNVVCNSNISVNAKYLYGWIQSEIYFGAFTKTIDDITTILNCSMPTARKCLKELKEHNFIGIEILKGNTRKITPLVSDSLIIMEKNSLKELEQNEYQNKLNKIKELLGVEDISKQVLIDFINKIK